MGAHKRKLDLTESSDFQYLLELMPAMHSEPEYAWLPELFSIVGYQNLILLSKFAGGNTIRIPTLDELVKSIEALQWYYDVYIAKKKEVTKIPLKYRKLVTKIAEVYDYQ